MASVYDLSTGRQWTGVSDSDTTPGTRSDSPIAANEPLGWASMKLKKRVGPADLACQPDLCYYPPSFDKTGTGWLRSRGR